MKVTKETEIPKKQKENKLTGMLKKVTFALKWRSIKTSFVIPFMVPLIVAVGIIGFLLFQGGYNAVGQVLVQLNSQIQNQMQDQLKRSMTQADQLNRINVDEWRADILNVADATSRERVFYTNLFNFPDIAMAYVGLPDGSFYGARRIQAGEIQVVKNDESTGHESLYYKTNDFGDAKAFVEKFSNFDPRKRPWYIKASEVGKPVFTDIYSHFVLKEPTITASYPVYEDNQLVAVFGVDYVLTWMTQSLKDLPLGARGAAFIVDHENRLVATSSGDPIFKIVADKSVLIPAIESSNPQIYRTISQNLSFNQESVAKMVIDKTVYYVGKTEFTDFDLNWDIYILIAQKDFLKDMNNALQKTGIAIVIFIMGISVATAVIAKWIVRPILVLNETAKRLSDGVFCEIKLDGRRDELGQLSSSFNNMGRQLTQTVSVLEEQIAERTRELVLKNEVLQQLSYLDGLTGIANRRKLDSFLAQAWHLAMRNQHAIVIMMLDIDWFKNYNDTYGHQVGDDCLKSLAELLQQIVNRSTDLVARYGGEEFIVVLQETNQSGAEEIAQEIRSSVEALGIAHKTSPYGVVTISIGVAYLIPKRNELEEKGIAKADEALYLAKESGRNRVRLIKP